MSSFDQKTTAEEVAQAFKGQITGKNVLITGVSPGGLGAETARVLASQGANLLICTGRTEAKVQKVFKSILSETPSANLRFISLDLASLESCKAASKEVLGYLEPLDILIGNAGTMAIPEARTKDGFEMQFGSNHLGHFYFFNSLISKFIESKSECKRIVMVSSVGHAYGGVNLAAPGYLNEEKNYMKWNAYAQSKSANMLYALSLSKKLESKGIKAFSLHPGIIESPLWRFLEKEDLQMMGVVDENGNKTGTFLVYGVPTPLKSLGQGAATTVVAAFSPSISENSGSYLSDCQISNESAQEFAKDEEIAQKLWKLSEEMVGQKLDL